MRKGGIGKVTAVRAFHIQNEWPKGIGNPPDEAAARGLRLGSLARPRAARCRTTRTAPSTASAGSTTIPAGS